MICWLLAALAAFAGVCTAQDQHYWTQQFGTRSHLMGGAVVGGCDDSSAGYYNPARLGWIENDSLSVGATLYQMDRFLIRDGAGDNRDIDAFNYRVVPTLASGVHIFDFAPRHVFSHLVLARHYWNNSASAREESREDIIVRNPGEEDYTGQITIDTSVQEYWLGIAWGWRVTDWLSVGATAFGAIRIEKLLANVNARAVWFNPSLGVFETASVGNDVYVNYFDIRAVLKLGLAFEHEGFKAGVTATAAGMHIFGQGTASRDLEIINIDTNSNGVGDSLILNDRQDERPTEYRSPWSFALGLEYAVAPTGTRIAFSCEYYLSVGTYTLLKPKSAPFFQGVGGNFPGNNDFLRVRDTREGVFNVAAAVSQHFGNWWLGDWTGYWSFYTDFCADVPKTGDSIQIGMTQWDLYHGITGIALKTEKHELAIGAHFMIGSDNIVGNIDLTSPTEAGLLFGPGKNTRGVYWSVGLVVGYTYFI